MKKQLLEEINKFKKLTGIQVLKEESGERGLAELLISRLVKAGEKTLPKEIGSFTSKTGVKSVLNVQAYKNLLTKDVLNVEEKDLLHTINKNIVREYGAEFFTKSIKEVTKNMGSLEAVALENKILKNFFDEATSNSIKSSLNIGAIKPEAPKPAEPSGLKPETPTIKVSAPPMPGVAGEILSVEQQNVIRKEINEVIKGGLNVEELTRITKGELEKISQIQKLKENEIGLKLLEEKAALEKQLMEAQKRNADIATREKELAIKEKEMAMKHQTDANAIDLKSKKSDLRLKRTQTTKEIILILLSLKTVIIIVCIYLFGWNSVWSAVKTFFSGDGAVGKWFKGNKSSGGSGSGEKINLKDL